MEGLQRRYSLRDQMAAVDSSSSLRDLLGINPQDDRRDQSDRTQTLLDIIQSEGPNSVVCNNNNIVLANDRRSCKNKLRLQGDGSSVEIPTSDGDSIRFQAVAPHREMARSEDSIMLRTILNESTQHEESSSFTVAPVQTTAINRDSTVQEREEERGTTIRLSAALAEEREAGRTREAESAESEAQTMRVSLMDLLEKTNRQMVVDDSEEEERGGGTLEENCWICRTRHKDAALIPCGHTFCRVCSGEVWVNRGSCPLCNASILDLLHLF